ncbi:hypothetical protein HPB48_002826 [Haemaphysalis longicornis]|uniref:Uncharacterized protein n=1 Tax=Haemaphysalis longicornis TaxID=44386 RepID=A0A9J6FFJ9_HAELO|nr:hypothetical protein HPB48_002826 [Haemaphysalis longicornis]
MFGMTMLTMTGFSGSRLSCLCIRKISNEGVATQASSSRRHMRHFFLYKVPPETKNFMFVLTRHFNSDPIESLFGTLRMYSGSNDVLDARAALSRLEKMLKTGIAASNALFKKQLH